MRGGLTRSALLAALLTVAGCEPGGTLRGTRVDPPREIPTLAFARADGGVEQLGAPASDAATRPVTVVFFGYTHCPDVCPTVLADWRRAREKLGADTAGVRFVFVTVDPARDTPDVAQRYATQFDRAFIGVAGDSAVTARALAAFGAAAIRESGDSASYLVSHSSHTFVLDARGRLVATLAFGSGWDALAHDLEVLQ